ncbi:hypothetical protein BH11BAC3_BH11BAC3_31700 [soil metagenome]
MSIIYQPLVSVIIAFLNEEKYLDDAVKSVLAQDYTNWELILIDDGSTDNSTQMALDYTTALKGKIIYCEHDQHKNRGLSASRNYGISKSKGNLIAILDADDVWLPGKLSNQVAIFEKNPGTGMIAEASSYWVSWSDKNLKDTTIPVGAEQDKLYEPPALMYILYPLRNGAAPCPTALILTAEAFKRSGGFEESFIKEFGLYEDQAFLSKIYSNEKVYISSACNNLYRQRPESIVSTVHISGKYHKVRRYFLEWLKADLEKRNITDIRLNRMVDKSLLYYQKPIIYGIKVALPKLLQQKIKRLFKR